MEKKFAQIVNNRVKNFLVSVDEKIDSNWFEKNFGGSWVEVADGTPVGKGVNYDYEKNIFYTDSPFEGWILNDETLQWEPPTPMPEDGNDYEWNEATTSWDLINGE